MPDNQGIVIGGIIEEKETKSHEGIPLLSSIPILGNLFRHTSYSTEKTELIVIIIPHVITNRTEGEEVTSEFLGKLSDMKEFLNSRESKANVTFPEDMEPSKADER